ncbi:MAG TPA: CoA transferase [Gemmatimonadaceae bacterium]|nr:CoA transferase [Gemmatimonadaceae bacterium]
MNAGAADRSLSGVRIVEAGGVGPVPLAAMFLADLGAEITRIDRPDTTTGIEPDNPMFRGRRSVELDFRNPQDFDYARDLIDDADILLEGFRPGVMERLNLGPQDCLERNARLIYGRMTGWGSDGPLASKGGHDINYISLTGALHAIGQRDGPPTPPLNLVGDYGGGSMMLVTGILAALYERERTGLGKVVEAAMIDGAATLMNQIYYMFTDGTWADSREANVLDGGTPFYCAYRTRDDRYVAIGPVEPKFFAELLKGLGLPESYIDRQWDRSFWPTLRGDITRVFLERDRDEWVDHFEQFDACVTPVLSIGEAFTHPYNVERGLFAKINGCPTAVSPLKFDGERPVISTYVPRRGEHTPPKLDLAR